VKLRTNANAATLALLALLTLSAAFVLPFISMSALGQVRTVSLLDGIRELFRDGHLLLGAVLLIFSVLFPIAKLGTILVATSALMPLRPGVRSRLCTLAAAAGKYSLLDVLVIAVLIVVLKFGGLAEAHPRVGTILFCVAVLLSMAAGACTDFRHLEEEP
jgi:paraquat-inducible protein A